MRFLIIQTAFLGDVILATPVVSELKRIFPEAEIDFLVRKGNESVLENNPHLKQVYVLNKKAGKFKEIKRLSKVFRGNQYDYVINLHRFGSSGIITWLSGANKKIGFDKNPFSFSYTKKFKHEIGTGKHEVERNLELIQEFGAEKLVRPQVFPSTENYRKIESLDLENYVCFAPASVWFTKQLPEHKWVELGNQLSNDTTIVFVGGPSDLELCERISKQIPNKHILNLAGKLSILESCALFEKAKRCYVNDSGPLHMASAVNAKQTAFFCATVPNFGFGPLSEDLQILETTETLDCRPCGLHGGKTCPKGHFKCGEIDLSAVK